MLKYSNELPHYNRTKSYDWNFTHSPTLSLEIDVPSWSRSSTYCGIPVDSPLGIAAGPLLNGNWVRYYAHLGFDVLTYKTVRSQLRDCYELPNLLPVDASMMTGEEDYVIPADQWSGSWAVSFGMPSKAPVFWQDDVRQTKSQLTDGQILSVSVVGTMQSGWGIEELAKDYADCTEMAFAANADCVEMNFSCPNVCSEDGQLFQTPDHAEYVSRIVRERVGDHSTLLVKIGYLPHHEDLRDLLLGLDQYVNGVVTTNSVPSRVLNQNKEPLFDGQQRGICGRATREASMTQVGNCKRIIQDNDLKLDIIGVGGIETAEHVQRYLDAGASTVQLATAAMVTPEVGIEIRKRFANSD